LGQNLNPDPVKVRKSTSFSHDGNKTLQHQLYRPSIELLLLPLALMFDVNLGFRCFGKAKELERFFAISNHLKFAAQKRRQKTVVIPRPLTICA